MMKRRLMTLCFLYSVSAISESSLSRRTSDEHDPTKPALISAEGSTDKNQNNKMAFHLQSIIIGKNKRLALVNGLFISVGEKVEGATLTEINKNSVVLLRSGRSITLYLFDLRIWSQKR